MDVLLPAVEGMVKKLQELSAELEKAGIDIEIGEKVRMRSKAFLGVEFYGSEEPEIILPAEPELVEVFEKLSPFVFTLVKENELRITFVLDRHARVACPFCSEELQLYFGVGGSVYPASCACGARIEYAVGDLAEELAYRFDHVVPVSKEEYIADGMRLVVVTEDDEEGIWSGFFFMKNS
jgi:hypothetical protein